MKVLTKEFINQLLKIVIVRRPVESHKGDFGKTLIIGGSQQFGGAVILSTKSCVYSGSGLTTVASVKENRTALLSHCPEAMVLDIEDIDGLINFMNTVDVVLMGPGMALSEDSKHIIHRVLKNLKEHQILIIDGSALTLISEQVTLIMNKPNVILTPHQKEWERLSGIPIPDQSPDTNQKFMDEFKGMLVLKKHQTEIYFQGNIAAIPYGNPGMATGGSGDVLAGMIAGFFAQFPPSFHTLIAAVSLHSMIADEIYKDNYVVIPSQLIQLIPQTMAKM